MKDIKIDSRDSRAVFDLSSGAHALKTKSSSSTDGGATTSGGGSDRSMLGAVIGDGDTMVLRCVINRPRVFVYRERGKRGDSRHAPLFLTCFKHATDILSLPLMPPCPPFHRPSPLP